MRQSRHAGFTLVETLIALSIAAIALPAILTLVSTQLESAGMIRERTYAYWVAQNELTRFQLLQREKLKNQTPNFKFPEKESGTRELMGMRWSWHMSSEVVEGLPVQGFKRVTIDVNLLGAAGATQPSNKISSRRPDASLARLTGFISDPDATF